MKTIKELVKEIEVLEKEHSKCRCAYNDYRNCFKFFELKAKLQTLKEVLKLIDDIFYYDSTEGKIPIVSIEKIEELKQRIEGK